MVAGRKVILQHIASRKLVAAGTIAGNVISALWYLGKEHVTEKTISRIKKELNKEEFEGVLKCTPKMPAWMAKHFDPYQKNV